MSTIAQNGAFPFKLVSAASTNATVVKSTFGWVYSLSLGNIAATARFLKLYDKATAPVVGTDTPVQTFLIPGNTTANQGAGSNITIPIALKFINGIALAITGGMADADTTTIGAGDVVVNLSFI